MNGTTSLVLRTPRLDLVAATLALARADLAGRAQFSSLLQAEVPESWPPPLNDDASKAWIVSMLSADPQAVGWSAWYFLRREGLRTAIGNGGFKGRPSADGTVEIGYSVLAECQRQGYAPEAVGALIDWAFSHADVRRVIAHTLPDGRASMRVLEKCGFQFVGPGLEEGAVLFERLRRAAGPASPDAQR